MARLNDLSDSDDELPELSTILAKTPKQEHSKVPSGINEAQNSTNSKSLVAKHENNLRAITKASSDKPQSRKQRPLSHLKQAHVNSLLLPISDVSTSKSRSEDYQSIETAGSVSNRISPTRLAKGIADHSRLAQVSAHTSIPIHDDDDSSTDLSGFIVPDSASDGESLVSMSPKKKKISTANLQESGFGMSGLPQSNTQQPTGTTALISPEEKVSSRTSSKSPPRNDPFRAELVEAHPDPDDRLTL